MTKHRAARRAAASAAYREIRFWLAALLCLAAWAILQNLEGLKCLMIG
jgi:hypothetical protein